MTTPALAAVLAHAPAGYFGLLAALAAALAFAAAYAWLGKPAIALALNAVALCLITLFPVVTGLVTWDRLSDILPGLLLTTGMFLAAEFLFLLFLLAWRALRDARARRHMPPPPPADGEP